MKKIKYYVLLITLSFILSGCSLFKRDSMENINIITTIYPLEYAINYLYGESSVVNSIYPDGINIDVYTLTEKQYKDNSNKDLFVYMGLSNDSTGLSNDSGIAVELLKRNKNLKLIDATYGMEYKVDISELWLNPSNLLMVLQNIKNGLAEFIDNTFIKEEINERYQKLKMILSEVDANLKTTIENATKKTIYTNSNALRFLEKYGLNVIVIDKELDIYEKNLALLNNAIEEEKIKYFFTLENSELDEEIKKLADTEKIKLEEFRNLKNITDEERNNKKDYVEIINENIELIKKEIY